MKRTITLEMPFWIGDRVQYTNPRASDRVYSVDQVSSGETRRRGRRWLASA